MEKVGLIQLTENLTYRVEIAEHGKNRFRVYFLTGNQKIPTDQSAVKQNDLPFISFSVIEKVVSILGMYIPQDTRGSGFSDIILSQFFNLMERSGLQIGTTTQIKKPILAAKLAKIGFIPERGDIIARILSVGEDGVPNVLIDQNLRRDKSLMVDPKNYSSSGRNEFYRISKSPDTGGKRVALQTKYYPPGNFTLQEYITQGRAMIEGKVKFYPARVKKILENGD